MYNQTYQTTPLQISSHDDSKRLGYNYESDNCINRTEIKNQTIDFPLIHFPLPKSSLFKNQISTFSTESDTRARRQLKYKIRNRYQQNSLKENKLI